MDETGKRCSRCNKVQPLTAFHRDRSAADGRQGWCKACKAEYQRSPAGKACQHRYTRSTRGQEVRGRYRNSKAGQKSLRRGRRRYAQSQHGREQIRRYRKSRRGRRLKRLRNQAWEKRNPDKVRAKTAVNNAIKLGHMPRPDTLSCTDCGQPACEFHHESYAEKDWLNVIPLCKACHTARHANKEGV